MVQNLRRVPLLSEFCPPPEELRGGDKKFFGRFALDLSPPELNPVSAPVYVYYVYTVYRQ